MQHILQHLTLTLAAISLCTACGTLYPTGPTYAPFAKSGEQYRVIAPPSKPQWINPTRPDANRVQDHVECLAIAAQGAQGYGAFFSDRMLREGLYNDQKEKLYNLCVQSRGYSFQVAR